MFCAAWIRGPEVGCILLLFQCSDLLLSTWHQPPSCHVVPHRQSLCQCWAKQGRLIPWPLPSCGSGSQNLREVPSSAWAHSTFFRTSFSIQCGGSFPGSFSLVRASFPSDRQDHGSQQWAAESSWFCLSPLYHSSATPSLVLTLSLSVSSLPSLYPSTPPPHLHCSLPCPAEEQGLIWRVHNNSCNSPALTGPPQARPGPRVQCQTHMCLPVRSEILILQRDSAVPSHDHILVPNPLFYFSPACYHQTQPPYHTLVPTFQQDCMPGQWNGTRARREEKRGALFEAGLHFNDIWAPPHPSCLSSWLWIAAWQHWTTGGQLLWSW